MSTETRRLLYGILAALAVAGLIVLLLAIFLAPTGVAYWIYGSLAIVIVALVAEVVLLFVGRPAQNEYDFVIDGNDGGEAPR